MSADEFYLHLLLPALVAVGWLLVGALVWRRGWFQ